jgi:hypothetical protein
MATAAIRSGSGRRTAGGYARSAAIKWPPASVSELTSPAVSKHRARIRSRPGLAQPLNAGIEASRASYAGHESRLRRQHRGWAAGRAEQLSACCGAMRCGPYCWSLRRGHRERSRTTCPGRPAALRRLYPEPDAPCLQAISCHRHCGRVWLPSHGTETSYVD